MKTAIRTLTIIFLFLLGTSQKSTAAFWGEELPAENPKNRLVQSLHLRFNNKANDNRQVDSVWVVLDRCDLTGAGVIRKIFYPGTDNRIEITDVPEGKYFATIITLGPVKKRFDKVIEIKKAKPQRKIREQILSLPYSPLYLPGEFVPPPENTRLFSYVRY